MTTFARPRVLVPVLALSFVTALWGSTFFMSKGVVTRHDPLTMLAIRFGMAALVMWLVRPRCLRGLSRTTWLRALVLGSIYGVAQIPQYYGLRLTSASEAGFLIGTYAAFTPVFAYLIFRARSSLPTLAGVLLALAGLAVFALQDWQFGLGESLLLTAAALYGLQIVALGAWSLPGQAWALTTIQMIAITVVVGVPALVIGVDMPTSRVDWLVIAYLALVASALAIGVQTWAQSRLAATHAAVIMAAEPVWAAGLAVLFTAEVLTGRLLVGGAMLVIANVVVTLSPSRPVTPPVPAGRSPEEQFVRRE
ncbi:DMT family transporter [Geodermatophilus sp. DF01_2]|uniref:DMT family transporter n=1 Tax=Geodermatophilus sp. DF01-2 TaxID=2559610 RepID=UPI00142F836E|nr:DMT family transporter [Geodermatophilus sp. DF01_2]